MARDDWFRNEEWSSETEAAFRARLSRSRSSRPQYLRIQASCLARRHPQAALGLIEEYFATGDEFEVPTAYCARAEAWLALGRTSEAVAAYKSALEWEESHPHHVSTARTDFPRLVAERRLVSEYDYALEILANRFTAMDHQFAETRYVWNGSNAIIAFEQGHVAEAREFAERALRAAMETQSRFRYHPTIGLVRRTSDEFGLRLKRIAQPSRLRAMLRLFTKA